MGVKKRGMLFALCKPPLLGIHRLMHIVEAFTKIKDYASNIIFSSKTLQTPKFYYFHSMDHKGSISHLNFLSSSQHVASWEMIIHTQQQNPHID